MLYLLEDAEGAPVAVVLPSGAGVEGSQPLPKLQEVGAPDRAPASPCGSAAAPAAR